MIYAVESNHSGRWRAYEGSLFTTLKTAQKNKKWWIAQRPDIGFRIQKYVRAT